jgi:hypothetical protein
MSVVSLGFAEKGPSVNVRYSERLFLGRAVADLKMENECFVDYSTPVQVTIAG